MRTFLHGSNDVALQWERIGVRYCKIVKLSDINNRLAFLFVGSGFSDYKNWKTERGMSLYINQAALPLKLVKSLIHKGFSLVIKWIDAWFNSIKVTLSVSMQRHGYPPFRRYLDKAERFPDRGKLIDKIRDVLNGQRLSLNSDSIRQIYFKAGF